MKASDLRQKSETELREEVIQLLRELFNLRMQRAAGQPAKPHLFKNARRGIARVKTILREKNGE